jgi:hypothetical protein
MKISRATSITPLKLVGIGKRTYNHSYFNIKETNNCNISIKMFQKETTARLQFTAYLTAKQMQIQNTNLFYPSRKQYSDMQFIPFLQDMQN